MFCVRKQMLGMALKRFLKMTAKERIFANNEKSHQEDASAQRWQRGLRPCWKRIQCQGDLAQDTATEETRHDLTWCCYDLHKKCTTIFANISSTKCNFRLGGCISISLWRGHMLRRMVCQAGLLHRQCLKRQAQYGIVFVRKWRTQTDAAKMRKIAKMRCHCIILR